MRATLDFFIHFLFIHVCSEIVIKLSFFKSVEYFLNYLFETYKMEHIYFRLLVYIIVLKISDATTIIRLLNGVAYTNKSRSNSCHYTKCRFKYLIKELTLNKLI